MAACRTELIEDVPGLRRLTPAWWDLWRRSPSATPFQSPAWLVPWWTSFAPGRLATVAVHDGQRLIALAPSWVEDGRLGRRLLPLGLGVTDYLDILVDPDRPDAGRALVDGVAGLPDWDLWSLEELAPTAAALRLALPDGCEHGETGQSACPVLVRGPDGGDPLGAIPSRQRRKIRMSQHRIARRNARLDRVDTPAIPAFLDDLVRLHGARWKTRGEPGVLADEAVLRFHAAALPELAAAGLLRASALRLDGQVAGVFYGLRHADRAYAYLGGFDPAFAFESPGTVLLADAVAGTFGEGAVEFHFLRGREEYKYAWGAEDRWNVCRSARRPAV